MNSLQGLEKNATATYLSNVRIIVPSDSQQTFAIQELSNYTPIYRMRFWHILDQKEANVPQRWQCSSRHSRSLAKSRCDMHLKNSFVEPLGGAPLFGRRCAVL